MSVRREADVRKILEILGLPDTESARAEDILEPQAGFSGVRRSFVRPDNPVPQKQPGSPVTNEKAKTQPEPRVAPQSHSSDPPCVQDLPVTGPVAADRPAPEAPEVIDNDLSQPYMSDEEALEIATKLHDATHADRRRCWDKSGADTGDFDSDELIDRLERSIELGFENPHFIGFLDAIKRGQGREYVAGVRQNRIREYQLKLVAGDATVLNAARKKGIIK